MDCCWTAIAVPTLRFVLQCLSVQVPYTRACERFNRLLELVHSQTGKGQGTVDFGLDILIKYRDTIHRDHL